MPLITVCDSGKDSANPHTRVDRTHIHVHQNTTNTSLSCKQTHIWPCHIIAHKPAYTHTWTSLRKVIEMHSHSQTQAHICKHYTLIYAHMHKQISKHFCTKNTNLLWFGLSSLSDLPCWHQPLPHKQNLLTNCFSIWVSQLCHSLWSQCYNTTAISRTDLIVRKTAWF